MTGGGSLDLTNDPRVQEGMGRGHDRTQLPARPAELPARSAHRLGQGVLGLRGEDADQIGRRRQVAGPGLAGSLGAGVAVAGLDAARRAVRRD